MLSHIYESFNPLIALLFFVAFIGLLVIFFGSKKEEEVEHAGCGCSCHGKKSACCACKNSTLTIAGASFVAGTSPSNIVAIQIAPVFVPAPDIDTTNAVVSVSFTIPAETGIGPIAASGTYAAQNPASLNVPIIVPFLSTFSSYTGSSINVDIHVAINFPNECCTVEVSQRLVLSTPFTTI